MGTWAKRDFMDRGYLYVLDQLAGLQLAIGNTPRLMMVKTTRQTDNGEIATVFIRLPDPTLVAGFEGFQKVSERDLPRDAVLLYGDLSEFHDCFRTSGP